MGYSIFSDTMADMTFQQIELAAREKQLVLFPIAVIEEHGPHLPLGTDVYLTFQFAKEVRRALREFGFHSLIVPPYYWGINVCTNGFAGSFTVEPKTMISVLCDSLACLKSWGFESIFLLNLHGDVAHTATIMDAVRKAYEELHVGAYFVVPESLWGRTELSKAKPYLIVPPNRPPSAYKSDPARQYVDNHAGGLETSLMLNDFPELVKADLAHGLQSSWTSLEDMKAWSQGGAKARRLTPLGYCGNPSNIDVEAARTDARNTIDGVAKAICRVQRDRP